jgi:hypothetical protein
MTAVEVRPLHLHTVESLCTDLVSGRPIGVGTDNAPFGLSGDAPRAVLDWYRRNPGRWKANVSQADAEALVDAALAKPPMLPAADARLATASARRLTLKRIEAHRFAGLHAYGPVDRPPPVFVYEPQAAVTLFEGLNGSGKTSLVNAVIWALTGQVLRPQRSPESGAEEFQCRLDGPAKDDEPTLHRLTPVTPLPDPAVYRPEQEWVAADTWVELSFADETGALLPPIRRTQTRTVRGKLEETLPNLAVLGIDPIALRTGTIMPGLLPFIQIGSASELGRAVAELTGLASLADLAAHAGRAKRRIDGEFVKAKERDIETADEAYNRTRTDLVNQLKAHPAISPTTLPPTPSKDASIEESLRNLVEHFEQAKAKALGAAKSVLGENFDPDDAKARSDLEDNIAPALAEAQQLGRLSSAARLAGLGKLTANDIADVQARLANILLEANVLATLAVDPSRAARTRLYARVAAWVQEHPDDARRDDQCAVCGSDLHDACDPVTGRPVSEHLEEARSRDAALLSQTLKHWAETTLGALKKDLPATLQSELNVDLPDHPSALIRATLIDELFATMPFARVLGNLKSRTAAACDAVIASWPPLPPAIVTALPSGLGDLSALQTAMSRLDRALLFATWRRDNDAAEAAFLVAIIGLMPKAGRETAEGSLISHLMSLDVIVKSAAPITAALSACARLKSDLSIRRTAERRLAAYSKASVAIEEVISLGSLAEQQVEQLRLQLQENAATWRRRIYAGAFPSTEHELVETGMTSEGQLELLVGARGVTAPAQHVANASALRASLFGFYLAFWEYVLRDRGGLKLLILDDPQELLDEENRERLAHAFAHLLEAEAQLIITTNDRRFAGHVATVIRKTTTIDHRSIHPVTPTRATLQTALSVVEIQRRQEAYEADIDDASAAREYASEFRLFLEARLGDLFDDAAYPAWSATNPAPDMVDHLNRLRGLVRTPPSDLFRSRALKNLCDDPALADGASTLALLNKAHHPRKYEIRPKEVAAAAADLIRLRKAADKAHEECRRWRRREKAEVTKSDIVSLTPITRPNLRVVIHPDLAAFTRSAATGETQEVEAEVLDAKWFVDKALFYLRCDNFGFAAPRGAIVIVQATPSMVGDRRLVIARRNASIFARRLLRSPSSGLVALAAETPDPRNSPQTLLLPESEVSLHQVVGVLFDDRLSPPSAKTEAVMIDSARVLERIETAYRVKEDSAVPLALPKQIALGGKCIPLDEFGGHKDALVALTLDDGSSIFKRVGSALPSPLSHLRQFESIGGLGESQTLSLNARQPGVRSVSEARLIVGVLYHGP